MAALSDSVGLLFRVKAEISDAVRDLGKLKGEVKDVGGAGEVAGSGLGSMINPATLAVTAVVAIGAAAVTAAISLFNLTKSASEYGSEIFDAKEKTGLSAVTLSTLKVAADNAGSSLDQVTSGAAKFAKLMGEASAGNEKAQKTLKDLGVTSKDLNTALSQSFTTIAKLPEGVEQITAAQKLYGKSGADLIPVIKQIGDLEEAKAEAIRNGTALTEKDIEASDRFGDALGLLSAQAKTAAVAFTSDLMPVLEGYFTSASEWYARNQSEVRLWGSIVAAVIGDMVRGFGVMVNTISDYATSLRVVLFGLTFGISEMLIKATELIGAFLKARGLAYQAANAGPQEAAAQAHATPSFGGGGSGGGKGGGGKSSGASAAERAAKDDLKARLDLEKLALKQLQDDYKTTLDNIREEFKKTGDDAVFAKAANAAREAFVPSASEIMSRLQAIETLQAKSDKETENQTKLRIAKQKEAIDGLNKYLEDETKKNGDLLSDYDQKLLEKRVTINQKLITQLLAQIQEFQDEYFKSEQETWDEIINNEQGHREAQNVLRGEAYNALALILDNEKNRRLGLLTDEYNAEKAKIEKEVKDETAKLELLDLLDKLYKDKALLTEEEFRKRKKAIEEKYSSPSASADGYDFDIGGSWKDFKDAVMADGPTIGETLAAIGNIGFNAFKQIADGIGQAVSAWVLYGTAGPNAMWKMVASVLAGVAAQSAVLAIFELAKGFAALFWNPGEAAAHFQAAALFGSIAAGAALGGRAIAGDSFKQSTSNGGLSSGGGSGSDADNGNRPGLLFTERFAGFEKRIGDMIGKATDRINEVTGMAGEHMQAFADKFGPVTPGHVVMAGAGDAAPQIFEAVSDHMGSDLRASTNFKRGSGDYR